MPAASAAVLPAAICASTSAKSYPREATAISLDISPARMARTMASTSRCGSVICMEGGAQVIFRM